MLSPLPCKSGCGHALLIGYSDRGPASSASFTVEWTHKERGLGEETRGDLARERQSPDWQYAWRPPRRGDWRSRVSTKTIQRDRNSRAKPRVRGPKIPIEPRAEPGGLLCTHRR